MSELKDVLAYEAGYEAGKRDAAPRWVRCEDELPKENGFYLVAVKAPHKGVRVYEYKPCNDMFYENENKWVRENGSYILNHLVTHWMPLPEPPKED